MFEFELSEQMTMVIINALGDHPYKHAAPVIAEIQKQVNAQVAQRGANGKMKQPEAQQRPNNV